MRPYPDRFYPVFDSVEWVRGYHRALHPEPRAAIGTTISAAWPRDPAFGASETRRFANPVPTTIDGFVETVSTHSWALMADPGERAASLARMRDYLTALAWDGTQRLDAWAVTYLGAADTRLNRAMAALWMISAVAWRM